MRGRSAAFQVPGLMSRYR